MSHLTFASCPLEKYDLLRDALAAASLPTDDIAQPGRAFFELADEQSTIGFVGLEGQGRDRLLRSLIVFSGRKQQGHGGLLLAHAEVTARRDGVERLHLLTTSAADFFRARGYHDADREGAPTPIRATAQFSSLCPGSASYLVKDLI